MQEWEGYLVDVIYALLGAAGPTERHVVVIAHRMGPPSLEKGYFYDSADHDHGGSGPFDWRLDEAVARAKRFAADIGLTQVVVRAKGD